MAAMHKVVVTGAAGLLGRHVAAAYRAAGFAVTALDLADGGLPDIRTADLTDAESAAAFIRDADCVAHIAAIPRPVGYPEEEVFQTNMTIMFNVLSAAEKAGIKRLLYASSFSVLGLPFAPRPVALDYLPIDEEHRARPQDVYALTKWLGEEMIDAWVRRSGGSAVSLRMPWIQTPESFALDVMKRRETAEAHLDLWAYIDVRDAARAFVLATEAETTGHERLFISAADSYSETPTEKLVAEHYGNVELREPLDDHCSLFSTIRAEDMIDFVPQFSWRNYPAVTVRG
ncbi:MAG: NAD(P)-dependent oxidoreductase [Shinella sp.]|nr:NAD(P)-dependent oxidoreductase [Shinella sp.]